MSATKRDAPDSLKNDSPKRPKLSQSPVSSVKKKKNKITFAQEIALNRESAAPGTDVSANGSVLKCAVCRLLGTRFSSYPSQSDHKYVNEYPMVQRVDCNACKDLPCIQQDGCRPTVRAVERVG
jgi:hypothetical protein